MDGKDPVKILKGMRGVLDARILERDVVSLLQNLESADRTFAGMPMDCPGMDACASKETVIALFCDGDYPAPEESMLELVDSRGVTIGHDVPECQRHRYEEPSVLWMTQNMVLYPEKMTEGEIRVVLHAFRMDMDGSDAWVYYPSKESADILNDMFGTTGRSLSTLIVGTDGSGHSMPMADVMDVSGGGCGHGEPAPENAFD